MADLIKTFAERQTSVYLRTGTKVIYLGLIKTCFYNVEEEEEDVK